MLADLESLEKRVPNLVKKGQKGDKEAKAGASVLGQALELLRAGKPARLTQPKDVEEERLFAQAQLLTAKPVLYVCNVDEGGAAEGNEHSARVFEIGRESCRERVCQYVSISVVAGSLKKKKKS